MNDINTLNTTCCYHCGDEISSRAISFNKLTFCCAGCQSVYKLLSENNLCDYYAIEEKAGVTIKEPISDVKFNYLNDEDIVSQLVNFKDNLKTKVIFHIPTMHCSSCIWLLENLYKINNAVISCRVDFLKKQLSITFNHQQISLKEIVVLLAQLGYEPALNLNSLNKEHVQKSANKLFYQLGVAGFCFGNIMLISFPEYFGLDTSSKAQFSKLFGYLNLVLSLPVFLYSAQDYFKSAYNNLKVKNINIDFPLALGILVMFLRSSYEVITHQGIGFFDTLTGLVFFLLIGKWAQQFTVNKFSFERDYQSYFPVAVTLINNPENPTSIAVNKLKIGDRIQIRNSEVIPADAILLKGNAQIDFSFVTGENDAVNKVLGEIIYAGGKQVGSAIELEVCKPVSQSYLTQLWNNDQFVKSDNKLFNSFQNNISKYFTIVLLAIAIVSSVYWLLVNPALSLNAFTSVLIIACPCALALSSPFALGNAMRMLGRSQFYLKSAQVVEQIASVNTIVFDKTGTITQPKNANIVFVGNALSQYQQQLVTLVCKNSVHPLSKKIVNYLDTTPLFEPILDYKEIAGNGITAYIGGQLIKVGSAKFLNVIETIHDTLDTKVYIQINDEVLGCFKITHAYRSDLLKVTDKLIKNFKLYLLSGDNNKQQGVLSKVFKPKAMHFNQTPSDKMHFVDNLKLTGLNVAMFGDGLNDAGALKTANVGFSVTENTAHFTPSSDVIMDAKVFNKIPNLFSYCKHTMYIIKASFVLSLCYNIVGLAFAVQGSLSPLIAAVLMPISSVSVIIFTTVSTYLLAKKNNLIK